MESSHCHNTGMAKVVHGMYSEYVPTQTATNGVRTTIDGFPIALFYRASSTSPMQYFGIYNFNDDKDNTDTFGYVSGTECWEVCNNTSRRTLFQISDYETIGTDGNPEWYADFEARYPDKNRDYTNLKRLTDWIVSTDGDLDKFKNEFEQYFNLHYTLVYCVITELFAMIDSRAKNMFLASWDKTIWYPVFYDMDSICGLNNEGELVFEYNVETNDTIGTQNVYNGKNSLLWQNFENAFSEEIKETYNSLRDSDKLTYEKVLSILEGQQINILSEAQYNEDAKYKYLDPLLNDNISTYLYIAQGSRINHLKYWLFNRFNYMDSKYIASDYKDNYATMRLYTPENWSGVRPNSNFTITPFANQYSTVKFGSYVISERSQADTPTEVVAPDIEFNDTETIIYGANRISSLGNLADKYAGTVDMSKATQLTELLIGSNASGYSNTNLKSVSVGNNKLLRKIDVRNCPSLTAPLDLSQCDNIQEVYATGTSITSVKFSNGTELTTLALPNTITSLTLINKKKLTSITTEGYGNLNILRIENSAINPFVIINSSPVLESVRLIGINCQTNVTNIQYLATLKGIDEDGVEIPIADAVSGNITIVECSREILEELKVIFPNVTFNVLAFTTSWNVTFVDGDGNVLYETKVLNNGEAIYLGGTPTKTSTAQYDYTWKGWDRQLKPIMNDSVINATFDNILKYYTVKFINSNTLEVVQESVLGYGTTIIYPELPNDANTWSPTDTIVTGDIEFYSKYIPYPEDLSIFTAYYTTWGQEKICGVSLVYKKITDSFIIYPFKMKGTYNNYYSTSKWIYTSSTSASHYTDIKEVYIPETIEYLGKDAFYFFTGLTKLNLSNIKGFISTNSDKPDVVFEANRQFLNCTSLEEVNLPKVQVLPKGASSSNAIFKECTNLKYVTMGSKEYPFHTWEEYSTTASYQHFYNSTNNLVYINLVTENGLESDVTFNYTISDSVKSKIIYSKTPVRIVTDEQGVSYLIESDEARIVSYSGTATELSISEIDGIPVTSVGYNAFNGKALTSISLPNVTTLGERCFYGCSKLTSIEIPNVTILGNNCFSGCTALTSASLPNATSLGVNCFMGCTALTSIEILNVTSLGSSCFSSCKNLTSISLPNATSLSNQCFSDCTALTSTSLPNATSLGNQCFSGCKNLTSISLPNVTTLGAGCFSDCTALTSIEIPEAISLGDDCLYNCSALTSISLPNVTSLGSYCFQNCSKLTLIEIPNVTSLGSNCFQNCIALTSIEIPNITSLGNNCFYSCSKLTSIEIPNVTSLGNSCFYSCSKLTSIEIPNATSLGNSCFFGCTALTSASLPNATSLDNYCFKSCSKLISIEIPNATSLGIQCFQNCIALTSIEIPNITSLGNSCFNGCGNIKIVTLGGYLKPIVDTSGFDTSAFNSNVTSLIIYVVDPTNPPSLTGSPWGAINATIGYKQA